MIIPFDTLESIIAHCGWYCADCKRNWPDMYKICIDSYDNASLLRDVREDLLKKVLAHNRKEKLEKLLK